MCMRTCMRVYVYVTYFSKLASHTTIRLNRSRELRPSCPSLGSQAAEVLKKLPLANKTCKEINSQKEKQGPSLQISVITCTASGNNPICISMIRDQPVSAMFELRFLSRNK